MKKRLLITSIVMMLVVAVALSTATYAWFTSNTKVTSSTVTLTAASNNAASLGIGWTETGTFSPNIEPVSPTGNTFAPALPSALTKDSTTMRLPGDDTEDENKVTFATEFATPNAAGTDMVFLGNGSATTPYIWNDGTGAGQGHKSFFIKNLSPASTISTVTVTLTQQTLTAASELLRVGVFVKDGSGDYVLKGVLAKVPTYAYNVVAVDSALTTAGTEENPYYFKKYLGKYVPAISGTELEVESGAADYYIGDTANSNEGATTAPANTFYTQVAATTNQAAYGSIGSGNSVNAIPTIATDNSIQVAANLGALDTVEIVVVVWEDAIALGDAEQGTESVVGLTFTAGAATVSNG